MNKFIYLFFPLFFSTSSFTQNTSGSVFVLVDVSASIPQESSNIRNDAKENVRGLILAQYNDAVARDKGWTWLGPTDPLIQDIISGKGSPLLDISQNSYCLIMPIGEVDRYKNYHLGQFANTSQFEDFFSQNYPTVFTDRSTFLNLARAMAAGVAKSASIAEYYLIEVTDDLQDTDDPARVLTNQEQEAIAKYGTSATVVTKLGTLSHIHQSVGYQIIISKINISNIAVPKTPVTPRNIDNPRLSILTPKGTQKAPKTMSIGNVAISWQCLGCKDSITYAISVVNTKDSKVRYNTKSTSTSTNVKVDKSGIYRITVSGDGMSATQYINVGSEGGGGFFIFLLVAALLGGIGYYFWNKRRTEQMDNPPPHSDNNPLFDTNPPNQGDTRPIPNNAQSGGGYDELSF